MGSQYDMPPEILKKIEWTETIPAGRASYTVQHTGMSQDQWNNLSDGQKKKYYVEYGGKDAGDPKSHQLPGTEHPKGQKWDYKAKDVGSDGYEGDSTALKNLATQIRNDLARWDLKLSEVGKSPITTQNVGDTDAGRNFVKAAGQANMGFGKAVGSIRGTLEALATQLEATAKTLKDAEDNTDQAARNVKA